MYYISKVDPVLLLVAIRFSPRSYALFRLCCVRPLWRMVSYLLQISKLDPWKTGMCLKIKRAIEAGAGQGEDEDEEDIDLT